MQFLQKMIEYVQKKLFHPFMSFFIISSFLTLYLAFLFYEHAFDKNHFLRFGPSKDVVFIGMTIDTWPKVYIIMLVSFFSSLLVEYHQTVMWDFIHSKVWNPAFKEKMPISKSSTMTLLAAEPFISFLLRILQFYVTMTMQLQFILPELVATALVAIPYSFMKANEKKY
jgi:hypothetical protein